MAITNTNRLQLLNARHNTETVVFPTFASLETHLLKYYEDNSKLAEPFIAYYTAEDGSVRMVLGIGNEGLTNPTGKPYDLIDVASMSAKLDEITESVDGAEEIVKEVKALVKDLETMVKQETLDREKADDNIATQVGLVKNDSTGEYVYTPDIDDEILRKSTSLVESIATLSKYIQDNNITYSFLESPTTIFETNTVDKTVEVKSNVKVSMENGGGDTSDDNIIVLKNDGIAAYIDLKYVEKKDTNAASKTYGKLLKGLEFTKSGMELGTTGREMYDQVNVDHATKFIELPHPEITVEEISPLKYEFKVDGITTATINIPRDQFIQKAEFKNNSLWLTFEVKDNEPYQIEIPLDDLVDVYLPGDGLSAVDGTDGVTFNVVVSPGSEKFLTVSSSGISVSGIQSAIDSAKADGITESIASSKEYTDSKGANVLANAKEYTDTKAKELETYADSKMSEAKNHADTNLTESKKYTDTKGTKVLANAKEYTDTKAGELKTYTNSKMSEAKTYTNTKLVESKAYTDTKASELLGVEADGVDENTIYGVKNRIDNASVTLTDEMDRKDEVVEANAQTYTDKAVAKETSERTNADTALSSRLDVIEGFGEGSIQKAVSDESAKIKASVKADLATEEKLRKESISAAVDGLVDKASTDFNTLSKIETIVKREREERIANDKKVALKISDTETVNMTLTSSDETGNEIKADVKISDMPDNVLRTDGKGLFVPNIDLAYDAPTNRLKLTSEGVTREIQLSGIKGIDNIIYKPDTKELVFEIVNSEGRTITTPVSLVGLIPTPVGTSDGVITIQTETVTDGAGKLVNNISATFHGSIKDVSGLEDALNDKSDVGHTHEISDVNGLNESLLGKAEKEHTHLASEVVGEFVATYTRSGDGSLVPEPHTFKTVDLVIQHILEVLALAIQEIGGLASEIKEVKTNIADLSDKVNQNSTAIANNTAEIAKVRSDMVLADAKVLDDAKKYSDDQMRNVDSKIKEVVEQVNTGTSEGVNYTVYNSTTQKYESKRFKLVGSKNQDGTDRIKVTVNEATGEIIIDVVNIDLGTYETTQE